MSKSTGNSVDRIVRNLIRLQPVNRVWNSPLLVAICITVPLLAGSLSGFSRLAGLASFGSLVILHYSPLKPLFQRMRLLLLCSLGILISMTLGLLFSGNLWISAVFILIYSFVVQIIIRLLKLKPPGNFFFLTIAIISCTQPHDLSLVPLKVGIVAAGTGFACITGLMYAIISKKQLEIPRQFPSVQNVSEPVYGKYVEGLIFGVFLFLTVIAGDFLEVRNPYWITVSCLAVMQGISRDHVWERSAQRVGGTFLGMLVCILILKTGSPIIVVCGTLFVLAFAMETFGNRNYAIAAFFATPITIILAEISNPAVATVGQLAVIRLEDTFIGSVIGAIGGYLLYHEKLRQAAVNSIRRTRIAIKRH